MVPTWIGRDEATAESPITDQADYHGAAADPLGEQSMAAEGVDVHPETDTGTLVGAGLAPAVSSRPRFRPPRTRASRPAPTPFNAMALEAQAVSDAPQSDLDDPDAPGIADPPGEASSASRGSRSKRDSRTGSRGRPSEPGTSRLAGAAGWKLSTAVLTAVAMLAVGWGVYQTTKLNRTESALKVSGASASAQIQGLEGRMAALEASNTQTSSDLATMQQQLSDFTGAVASSQESAKSQYDKVTQSLSVSPADYKSAVAQNSALSTAYLTARAASDSAPADQEAQIKSLEAKSLLLANCAKIWAGAAQQVYTADSPSEVMATVGKDLAAAAAACKVVTQ